MSVKERVVQILKEIKPTANLVDIKDIVEGGYLDSLELLGLITALQGQFGVEIGFEYITPENFNSVEAMAALVEQLKK